MCGRFTVKATWAEIVALYRLTMNAPPHNLRPRYNVCPTDPVDVVTAQDGKRELVTMRWGLVPWWWSKPLKELRMGDIQRPRGDSRNQARFPRCVQAFTLPHPDLRLLRVAEHPKRQATLVLHRRRRLAAPDRCWSLGRMEEPRDRRAAKVLHDDRW